MGFSQNALLPQLPFLDSPFTPPFQDILAQTPSQDLPATPSFHSSPFQTIGLAPLARTPRPSCPDLPAQTTLCQTFLPTLLVPATPPTPSYPRPLQTPLPRILPVHHLQTPLP